jgi:hypothetical protein
MKILTSFILLIFASFTWAESYEVVHQKGVVTITRGGKPATRPIMTGDRIVVEKGGILILKNNQEVLKLLGDTIIRPRETKEGSLIDLVRGGIVAQITKKVFRIRSNATTFGVRGTKFFVQAEGNNNSWMCVQEGIVNAKTKTSNVDVKAGLGVFVNPKEISKPEAYPWTKGINWKMDSTGGELDHKLNLTYDVLEKPYD